MFCKISSKGVRELNLMLNNAMILQKKNCFQLVTLGFDWIDGYYHQWKWK